MRIHKRNKSATMQTDVKDLFMGLMHRFLLSVCCIFTFTKKQKVYAFFLPLNLKELIDISSYVLVMRSDVKELIVYVTRYFKEIQSVTKANG